MTPVAKKWYDNLAKGKINGIKCNDCGAYTFPPLTCCRECGSRNIKEVEMSGEGELVMYSSTMLPAEKFQDLGKNAYGLVKLNEGPVFFTQIEGMKCETPEEIRKGNDLLPIKVKAKIKEVVGMNIVVFAEK